MSAMMRSLGWEPNAKALWPFFLRGKYRWTRIGSGLASLLKHQTSVDSGKLGELEPVCRDVVYCSKVPGLQSDSGVLTWARPRERMYHGNL